MDENEYINRRFRTIPSIATSLFNGRRALFEQHFRTTTSLTTASAGSRERGSGTIHDFHGRNLRDIAGVGSGFGPWNHGRDSISPDDRIERDPKLKALIEEKTAPEYLKRFYIPASNGSPVRCTDGRPDKKVQDRIDRGEVVEPGDRGPLGAQYFGGSPGAALIHRIVDGDSMPGDATFLDDINDAIEAYKKIGVRFGGHIDEKNHGHPKNTGCGAIDRIPEIFSKMLNPEFQKEFHRLIDAILPHEFQVRRVDDITNQLGKLNARAGQYFEVDQKTKTPKYKKAIIEKLQKDDPDAVGTMVGEHNECIFLVNKVKGTTFDRDALNADTEGKVQVFNYDLWGKIEMAKTLYPNDTEKQHKYVICSVMFAMAALMVMTDGSLRVLTHE